MRILIFKINELGDNVLFVPVVQQLVQDFGAECVDIFTSKVAAPLYLGCLPAERVHAIPRNEFNAAWKSPLRLFRLLWQVRKLRPEVCILAEDQGNVAHALAWASGAKWRIGTLRPFLKVRKALNVSVPARNDLDYALWPWVILKKFYEIAGRPALPATPPPPDLAHLVSPKPRFDFVIHPGASREYKRWLPERFVLLANRLAEQHSVLWILHREAPPEGLSGNVALGNTSNLGDLVSLIAAGRVFVGNNSGPMNIAQSLGVSGLIISGPNRPTWDPFWNREKFRILRDESLACICCDPPELFRGYCTNLADPLACMKAWSVEAVFEECLNLRRKQGDRPDTVP